MKIKLTTFDEENQTESPEGYPDLVDVIPNAAGVLVAVWSSAVIALSTSEDNHE